MKRHILLKFLMTAFSFTASATYADVFPYLQNSDSYTPRLPSIESSRQEITISGISSGGFMAIQMQVAHSSLIKGVATFAGGIWGCAEGDPLKAQDLCMENPHKIISQTHVERAATLAERNLIDSLNNLTNVPFYIFNGSKDSTVRVEAALRVQEFAQAFNGKTFLKVDIPAEHGFPTLSQGNDCDKKAAPWVQNCNYDGAGNALNFLLKNLRLPKNIKQVEANLQIFSQKEFQTPGSSLADYGHIYIPSACRKQINNDCKVHVALHGCRMSPDVAGEAFIRYAGYNDWAEANKLVILYPSVKASETINPRGCWDWFGYTGSNFLTKEAKQITALKNMIDRLVAK